MDLVTCTCSRKKPFITTGSEMFLGFQGNVISTHRSFCDEFIPVLVVTKNLQEIYILFLSRHTRDYPLWSPLDAIQHIAIDPNQETLLITTLRKQLYYVKLFGQHMLQVRGYLLGAVCITYTLHHYANICPHRTQRSRSRSSALRCILGE